MTFGATGASSRQWLAPLRGHLLAQKPAGEAATWPRIAHAGPSRLPRQVASVSWPSLAHAPRSIGTLAAASPSSSRQQHAPHAEARAVNVGSLDFLHEAGLPFLKAPRAGPLSQHEPPPPRAPPPRESPRPPEADPPPPVEPAPVVQSQPDSPPREPRRPAVAAGKRPKVAAPALPRRARFIDYERWLLQRRTGGKRPTNAFHLANLAAPEAEGRERASWRRASESWSRADSYIALRARAVRDAPHSAQGRASATQIIAGLAKLSDDDLVALAQSVVATFRSEQHGEKGRYAEHIFATFLQDVCTEGAPQPFYGTTLPLLALPTPSRGAAVRAASLLTSSSRASDPTTALLPALRERADKIQRSFRRHRAWEERLAEDALQKQVAASPTLFATGPGSARRELVLSTLVREAAALGILHQQPHSTEPTLSPSLCAALVRALVREHREDSPDALPLALSALAPADMRGLLLQLLRDGDPSLLPVIEALQRRLQAPGPAPGADFPTLDEAARLIEYYLHPTVFAIEYDRPFNQERRSQAVGSALKVFRGLLRRLEAQPVADDGSPKVGDIVRQGQQDGRSIVESLEARMEDPQLFDALRVNLTFCLTLRITMLRLLLRSGHVQRAAALLRELANDLGRWQRHPSLIPGPASFEDPWLGETDPSQAPEPQENQPVEPATALVEPGSATALVSLLCTQVLRACDSQHAKALDYVGEAISRLDRDTVRELGYANLAHFVAMACDARHGRSAAAVVAAVEAIEGRETFRRLQVAPQHLFTMLEALLANGQVRQARLLLQHLSIDDFDSDADRSHFLAMVAKARLSDATMEAYFRMPSPQSMSAKALWYMVKLIVDQGDPGSVAFAQQIFEQYHQQSMGAPGGPDATYATAAALYLQREVEAVSHLREATGNSAQVDATVMAAVMRQLARSDPALATKIVRTALSGKHEQLAQLSPALSRLLQGASSTDLLDRTLSSLFDVFCQNGLLHHADELYDLAIAREIRLGPSSRRFAFLRTFHHCQPLTVAFTLSSTKGVSAVINDNAGVICWLIKAAARGQTVRQALEAMRKRAAGQTLSPRSQSADDISLEAAVRLFRQLFRETGLVDLSTAQLLLKKLRGCGLQVVAGYRDRGRDQWHRDVDTIMKCAMRASELRYVTPFDHQPKSREAGRDRTTYIKNPLPESLLHAGASAYAALRDGRGMGWVLGVMQSQGMDTTAVRQQLAQEMY